MCKKQRAKGFTLVEVIVALLIFAVIGVIVSVAMHRIIETRAHLQKIQQQLTQLQMADTLMMRDINNMVDRSVLDGQGSQEPALIASSTSMLTFTHAGFINPLMVDQRSQLQRVTYALAGQRLIRLTWPVLDRAANTTPIRQQLLTGVDSMTMQFVNDFGQLENSWVMGVGNGEGSALPRAIIMTLKLKSLGTVTRVFAVGGVGKYEMPIINL